MVTSIDDDGRVVEATVEELVVAVETVVDCKPAIVDSVAVVKLNVVVAVEIAAVTFVKEYGDEASTDVRFIDAEEVIPVSEEYDSVTFDSMVVVKFHIDEAVDSVALSFAKVYSDEPSNDVRFVATEVVTV